MLLVGIAVASFVKHQPDRPVRHNGQRGRRPDAVVSADADVECATGVTPAQLCARDGRALDWARRHPSVPQLQVHDRANNMADLYCARLPP